MEFDRAAEHIGQGIMLNDLKFTTWVESRKDSKLGFRVKKQAYWKTLFKDLNPTQHHCVEQFLGQFGIPLQEKYHGTMDLSMIISMINAAEKIYQTKQAFGDPNGLHMVEWVLDNPMPTDDMDALEEWGKYYDDEKNSLGIGVERRW